MPIMIEEAIGQCPPNLIKGWQNVANKAEKAGLQNIYNFAVLKLRAAEIYLRVCHCNKWGKDDGDFTCFLHHDCADGSCTHAE